MRKPVMAGNWKMYKTPAETTAFFEKFRPLVEKSEHCEIVICPPFTNLAAAVDAAKGSPVRVGAQNIAWAKEGAFTGEISGAMIAASGATYAIVGHSERRQYFGETDETVLKRTQAALDAGLTPIEVFDVSSPFHYRDLSTAIRALNSAGVAVRAMENSSEQAVSDAHAQALAPFVQPDGSYRISASFRCLLARP